MNKSISKSKTDHLWSICDETVKIFYEFLLSDDELNGNNYHRWKINFTTLHGFLDTQRKVNIHDITSNYKISFKKEDDIFQFIFCLETLYTIILRIIAYNVVFRSNKLDEHAFDQDFFEQKGIKNYTCKTYFNWFLGIPNIETSLQSIFDGLIDSYLTDLQTDFIKEIFENIVPSPVRHSMGEFYTPDWLANFVIETLTTNDKLAHTKTYLDPTCGSGTFLFNIIKKFQKQSEGKILKNVFGIDINPVSVLAAKTNYLLLYGSENNFDDAHSLYIPIFYADTINSPFPETTLFAKNANGYEKVDIPKVDYIVGNPPWVNWEYMPKEYRNKTVELWQYYGLFNVKGLDAGFIKEDISVLLTYVVLDKYLKDAGKLGFVVKETLFKSIKQGEGFRRFEIVPTNTPLKPFRVDDLTAFKPFNGAVNRSALLFIEKDKKLIYPVDYVCWKPINGKRSFENDFPIDKLNEYFDFEFKKAKPCDAKNRRSGWITVLPEFVDITNKVLGESFYRARTGMFTGGANGIFWLQILEKNGDIVKVKNITKRAKNKVKTVEKNVETDFVFPFLTGSELKFWKYDYSKYVVCPHTAKTKMYPIALEVLQQFPLTLEYFETFKEELENRKGFTSFDKHIHVNNYYTTQRIGEYTFAKYKVAWRYIAKNFTPAVIEYANDEYLGQKNIIPNEKIIFIGLDDKQEAYYLCGLLSSTLYRHTIESYMVGTQITPSIIKRLNLPKFDKANTYHRAISELCEKGHGEDNKEFYIQQIDKSVEDMLLNTTHIAMPSLL